MARYKPAADKIAEHFALKAKAQAVVSQMTTEQLKKFLHGRGPRNTQASPVERQGTQNDQN